MALFAVNTGCRVQEVCGLRWEYEVGVPWLDTSVFIIPKGKEKNKSDALVALDEAPRQVIEQLRGHHPEWVFSRRGRRATRFSTDAWSRARIAAELPNVRVHDPRLAFGRRLHAAGVFF
jgi:integrase